MGTGGGLILLMASVGGAAAPGWQQEGEVGWAELQPAEPGRIGFTRLSAEQTGIRFTNVLEEWSSAANRTLENGSGVAIGDFDRDNRPDIFFCSLSGRNALYRNRGGWRFEEVTDGAGIALTNEICRGAVFADINGDSWPDLLVSILGRGVRCFLNRTGRFENVTGQAGTESKLGAMTMALADVDGNGTLDLYVANYRTDDIRDHSRIEVRKINNRWVVAPALRDRIVVVPGGLLEYGEPDQLYLNDGGGRFRKVSWTEGRFLDDAGKPLTVPPRDWGLSAAFRDINGDGLPDLYVCNDFWTPDRIWINDGSGRFRAIDKLAVRHTPENSMGVDVADIDRDGHVDVLVLDMLSRDAARRKRQALAQTRMPAAVGEVANRPQIMRNALFRNRGDGTFEEIADYCGLPASDWSWQPVFVDVDLDGYEDVLITAGHTRDVQDLDATMQIRSRQHPWPKEMDAKTLQEAFTRELMEHTRLYPPLPQPIVAFRNLGNLSFAETTGLWGTAEPGVHQGIALGDLDGDGDLDFVVNRLNGPAGLYRNESAAPRIAVRLKGLAPNTQGIGARVKLLGGAVPVQSQEMACGGRYLSGFEPLLVFGTGGAIEGLTIEVTWRNGKMSIVPRVRPNRLYEVSECEAAAEPAPVVVQSGRLGAVPLFHDVSERIWHSHTENEFDDFERQPLLPKRLSQAGPGVCWFDLDRDGHDDLIVGSGRGGRLAVFHGDGRGGFRPWNDPLIIAPLEQDQSGILGLRTGDQTLLLSGMASYEDPRADTNAVRVYDLARKRISAVVSGDGSSIGPLALGDLEGDGDLDLFVGGRVIPGRYPEPASSRIFRWQNGSWHSDEASNRRLEKIGLVSGAVWSDLTGDGLPELVLACEWGPIRLFQNEAGQLREVTAERGLSAHTGWWNGVATGDLDGDGRLDIVAANWGLNSPYRASTEEPLRLYYGDLIGRGAVELIETEFDPSRRTAWPRHRLDYLARGLPYLREQFATYRAFSEATIEEALGDRASRAASIEVRTLASMLFLNRRDQFEPVSLPPQAQFSPAFSIQVAEFDGDGREDVFLSQNFFALPWELHRLDGGRGLLLLGDGAGNLRAVSGAESGIRIYGEQRGAAVADFDRDGRADLAVSQNGAATKLFLNQGGKPGLRVRLKGPAGNPLGIGSVLRLRFGSRLGPAREVQAGSGYWSQNSAVQVMGTRETPDEIQVRWPGGRLTRRMIPAGASEIEVSLADEAD